MSKAVAIICIILGVVLLACMGFGVYVLLESTNYFKDKATDFWVTVDGKRYYANSSSLILFDSDVDVHYLVEWLSRKEGYSYKVVPAGNDFAYMVDGEIYNWLSIEDLTPSFEISESAKGFNIKAADKTIAEVLQALHSNSSNIVVPTDEDGKAHFKLIVTSVDGKTIELLFRCSKAVEDIEISPPVVVF